SDDLRGRHGDAVWRVPRTDRRADVYVLLAVQSSADRHMGLRTLVYTGLLHQNLLKHQRGCGAGNRLMSPVLSISLYNGRWRWRAPTDLRSLMPPLPRDLAAYQPHQRFLLIDEGACVMDLSSQSNNSVDALFRLEHHR